MAEIRTRSGLLKVSRHSAVEAVRSQLIGLITSGHYQVNERLPSELELTQTLGVSRSVVREALTSLRTLGLTTSHNGKGTSVASNQIRMPLSFGNYSADQLNEVRVHLEVPSAQLAAQRRTDEELRRIGVALEHLERIDHPEKRASADAQFHTAIAKATGNALLCRLIEDIVRILEEQFLAVAVLSGRREQGDREHRRLYEAIAAGDAEAARNAMAEHLHAVEGVVKTRQPTPADGNAPRKARRR